MNTKTLTLGSLFDGSGGFPLGGLLAGVTPVWASEIEPFPIRVTSRRLPFMKHYGDISRMDGGKIEPVDIITFGSPCTDMSVAGKRAGLDGQQSVLFYQAVRIIKEMRKATNGVYPRFIVWENVPGAFSSNRGEDFKAVLEAIIGIVEPDAPALPAPEKGKWPYADCCVGNGWSLAYRTLDAQYWGVPQRRRRIYLVADFAGGRAPEILFKSEGLSGYSTSGIRPWQRAAGCAASCAGTSGGGYDGYNGKLTEEAPATSDVMESAGFCTEHSAKSRSIGYEDERSPTLRAGVVPAAIALENHPTDGRIKIEENDTVQTLTSRMGTGGMNVPLLMKIRSGCEGGGKGPLIQTDKSATLSCNNDQTLFSPCNWDGGQIAPTLTAHNAGGNQRMPDKDHFNCVVQPFVKGTRPHSPEEGQEWKASETANTLNTFDVGESRCNELAVNAYGISSKDSNAMKSDNPHAGIYKAETARTIDRSGGNPTCNQGGIAIVETVALEGNGTRPSHKGSGYAEGDIGYTLNATEVHGVAYEEKPIYAMTTGTYAQVSEDKAPTLLSRDYKDATVVSEPSYGIGRDAFNQGQNAKYQPTIEEELQPTIVAKGPGAVAVGFYPQMKAESMTPLSDKSVTLVNGTNPGVQNGVVENAYTVRRLTPTECARLQGFPDWWCEGLETAAPSVDEIREWYGVFETFRKITSPDTKPRALKQIAKWLTSPHSDAAEYKMWGNGVALPCVFFVLSGIVYCTQNTDA
ncbi:MAG: DNA cytosine methyltransferase [Clostridia bacterium]|nr:DNA cytosine methyltransferase [Clostridia bacterium]